MKKQHAKDWAEVREKAKASQEVAEDLIDDEDDFLAQAEENESAIDYKSRDDLEAQLLAAEKKAEENWDKATRAVAEVENIRRRAERDVANAHKFGVEKLIKDLIPVVDSLEQALANADKEKHKDMAHGIELTLKLLLDALAKHEVVQLNPAGQPFNPQEHEAMTTQPSNEVPSNTVLEVFQKGYKLNDRVIRPARVIVSKA
ncbi:MAG: nucleotide exchange factor GrpE [Legionellales bacterium RIFCSPHIGHO2_12_FULL_37_14]|nr:MAG: nucleotide exchange factor GrpE [Legionellales bacterium RIFCSPHIGHO2_12_FULL_37_14]